MYVDELETFEREHVRHLKIDCVLELHARREAPRRSAAN
jgi:hypothetical protein